MCLCVLVCFSFICGGVEYPNDALTDFDFVEYLRAVFVVLSYEMYHLH